MGRLDLELVCLLKLLKSVLRVIALKYVLSYFIRVLDTVLYSKIKEDIIIHECALGSNKFINNLVWFCKKSGNIDKSGLCLYFQNFCEFQVRREITRSRSLNWTGTEPLK